MDWKIYYADGFTFSSEDGFWDDAPQDGVVAIRCRDDAMLSCTIHGRDFYYKLDGPIDLYATNDLGAQLRARCPWLKFGVCTSIKDYKRIRKAAIEDPDFPESKHPMRRVGDGGRDR